MAKIPAINSVSKNYASEMQQVLRSIPTIATARPNAPAPTSLLKGEFKLGGIPNVALESRAVFPELPASGTVILPSRFNPNDLTELNSSVLKPMVGSKLNIVG